MSIGTFSNRGGGGSATLSMRRGADGAFTAKPDVEQLDSLSHWLDTRFRLFGVRFGLDSVLGLVPGVGDVVGMGLSAYLVGQAYRLGARKRTLARMGLNVLGDTIVGSIPLVGTVVDVMWKANRANISLLKRDLERPETMRRF